MMTNGMLELVMATVLDQWHDSVSETYESRVIGKFDKFLFFIE